MPTNQKPRSQSRKSEPDQPGRIVLHRFAKNSGEEVQASITTFKGVRYLDLRAYWRNDVGEFLPSRKGLTLALDLVAELRAAVEALERGIEERGLAA